MTNAQKTILTLTRAASVIADFSALSTAIAEGFKADANEAKTVQETARELAAQVKNELPAELPLATKLALVRATYADEFSTLSSTKGLDPLQAKRKSNASAGLTAAITCYIMADTPIQVAPPKDGKEATFKKAGELSYSAMRAAAAEVKTIAKEAEAKIETEAKLAAMSVEEKKVEQVKADIAAKAAQVKKAEEAKIAADKSALAVISSLDSQFAYIMGDADLRATLAAKLADHGYALTKSKQAPKEKGTLSDQLKALTK